MRSIQSRREIKERIRKKKGKTISEVFQEAMNLGQKNTKVRSESK